MTQLFSNAARGYLASAIGPEDTTITLREGGELFPTLSEGEWFKAVIEAKDLLEVIYVKAHSEGSNTFSEVLRGQEGTVASTFNENAVVGLRITAEDASKWNDKVSRVADHGLYPDADKAKLALIEDEATKNATDAELRDRATHTGEQAISTVTGLQTALNEKVSQNGSASLTRYDLASATATSALNLANQQVFRVNATSLSRTISLTNAPGANRAMTVVIHITGNKTVTWPSSIVWDEGSAPELGDNFTRVILFWDGVIWTGTLGAAR